MTPLETLAVRMHAARVEVLRLKKLLASMPCLREGENQRHPCWKAIWVKPQIGDFGRVELAGYWDHAGGNSDSDDGDHSVLWCKNCRKRERVRTRNKQSLTTMKLRLAGLQSQFWRAAAKLSIESQP